MTQSNLHNGLSTVSFSLSAWLETLFKSGLSIISLPYVNFWEDWKMETLVLTSSISFVGWVFFSEIHIFTKILVLLFHVLTIWYQWMFYIVQCIDRGHIILDFFLPNFTWFCVLYCAAQKVWWLEYFIESHPTWLSWVSCNPQISSEHLEGKKFNII